MKYENFFFIKMIKRPDIIFLLAHFCFCMGFKNKYEMFRYLARNRL